MTAKPELDEVNASVAETQETENQENGRVDDTVYEGSGKANPESKEDGSPQVEEEQERNWRQFRERRKQERQQAEEAARVAQQKAEEAEALKKALEALVDKPQKKKKAASYEDYYDDEESEEQEEESMEKKLEKMLDERDRKRNEDAQRQELAQLPQRLARDFKDFDRICTQENLDYFEYHYPEVASAYKYMPDGYEKWASVYKAINRFMPEVKNKSAQRLATENLSKPKSPSAPGAEQTSDGAPMYLDEQRRQANWKRMQKVMKGIE